MEHNIFLAIEALKENFGDIVSKVGEAIIKSDGAQSTLSSIVHSTKLKRNQVGSLNVLVKVFYKQTISNNCFLFNIYVEI